MVVPTKITKQIPTGPVKLAVGIEESREQRHQRQLSRFRNRGGIFVPTERNTLADILMGRRAVSPKKSLRRSASPMKRDTRLEDVADSKRVVSPVKTPKKRRTHGVSKLSSGQMQKKRKLEADTQEAQPTLADTKTQSKRRAAKTRRVQESLETEQETTVISKNATKSKPAPRKRGARKPAKSKNEARIRKPPKGLPERVLQRLKNSVPHTIDDEPDPINFLS